MSTVVIIGAGLAGLSTARALQQRGWQVTVLDANAAPAMGTSFANAGMLTPSMSDPWNAPGLLRYLLTSIGHENSSFLLRLGALPSTLSWGLRFLSHSRRLDFEQACVANFSLARYSLEQMRQWQSSMGLQYQQRSNGTMKLFRSSSELKAPLAIAQQLAPLGLNYKHLNAAEAVAHEPSLAPIETQLAGAIWYPDDASGNAYDFCRALAQQLEKDGAVLAYKQPVTRWRKQGSRVMGLSTPVADYEADAIVVAAGVQSAALLKPLGLDLMVRPVKGYSLSLATDNMQGLPCLPIIDEALHCAITPFNNSLRVAGTAELAGYKLAVTPARIENLRQILTAVLPQQAPQLLQQEAQEWAGLRPMSADGLPYIGGLELGVELERLYLNTGHGHLGWTHSVGSAELLAAQMDGDKPSLNTRPYRASRILSDV